MVEIIPKGRVYAPLTYCRMVLHAEIAFRHSGADITFVIEFEPRMNEANQLPLPVSSPWQRGVRIQIS